MLGNDMRVDGSGISLQKIQIGAAAHCEQVRQRLEFEASFMRDEGFDVRITPSKRGSMTFYDVNCRPTPAATKLGSPEDLECIVRQHLANAVSDLVVNLWERQLLRRIAKGECNDLEPTERSQVVAQAEMVLDGHPWRREAGVMRKVARKGYVLQEVDRYLASHRVLIIDGFIRFRLRRYLGQLEEAMEQAVDEFMLEKEYREFISLLRNFLAAQEPRVDRVHVLVRGDGGFRLVDDNGSSVSERFLTECLHESGTKDINLDDLLVSALITIAPRRVRLHAPVGTDSEGLRTLRAVFSDRLTVCHGCELCGMRIQRDEAEGGVRPH
jgi:putative sporulation protein YtxC